MDGKTFQAWHLALLGSRVDVDARGLREPNLAEMRLRPATPADRFTDIQAFRSVPEHVDAIAVVDLVRVPGPKGSLFFPPAAPFASGNLPLLVLVDCVVELTTGILGGKALAGQFLELANTSRDSCSI